MEVTPLKPRRSGDPDRLAASSDPDLASAQSESPSERGRSLGEILADADLSLATKIITAATLVSPFFFWGTSMVAMKTVAPHTSPFFVGAVRLIPAGLLLVAWAASQDRKMPSGRAAWAAIALFAVVDGALFQGLLAQGLKTTSAGLGSVIIDSQPLSVAVLSAIFLGEALSGNAVAGLLIGVLGLLLLEIPPVGPCLPYLLHQDCVST